MTDDLIELRLPLKPEYLAVLRATMGVVAGTASFRYDEIMQLRVAVSELFDLAVKQVALRGWGPEENELDVRFAVAPDKLEILMTGPKEYTGPLDSEEGRESQAVLRSLMDEVEFGIEAADGTRVRMVKYKSTEEG